MATIKINAEDQIRRLNIIVSVVEKFQELSLEELNRKPNAKQWSIIEVIGHMNQAYVDYKDKIDHAVNTFPKKEHEVSETHIAKGMGKVAINMIRPNNGQRKWKMKTMKKFEPNSVLSNASESEIKDTFQTFFENQQHLKSAVLASRQLDVKKHKITSAIGPVVKFYLPDCFEFIISHEERHVLQIEELLAIFRKMQVAV
ncbi:MAG: DinB family protein [Bacteroidota bacterium]